VGKYITLISGFHLKQNILQGKDDTISRGGYYAQLAGFVIPEKLQLVVKYDVYDGNLDVDENVSTIYTAGLNFIPHQWAKLQVAYDMNHEQAETQTKNDQIQMMLQLMF
jgi:hypothetical protein